MEHFSSFALDLTSANSCLTLTRADGTWPARASARPSAAWDTGPWKYTAPRSAAPTERLRRWTTATAAGSTNPTTRKAATETATRAAGTTRPGPRWEHQLLFPCLLVAVLLTFSAVSLHRQCTKSCGGGTRRRGAVCRKAAEAGGDESKCSQRDKLTVQSCNEFLCPQWKTGDWSEVSSAAMGWSPCIDWIT